MMQTLIPSLMDDSYLAIFISTARHQDTIERDVVECGTERWSYGDLDAISTGLAVELKAAYGLRPIVAVVSENHPYVLAITIATWKLGGIIAPLDHHAPEYLLRQMLINIAPTCVLVPSNAQEAKDTAKGLSIPCISLIPKDTTLTALSQRFLDQSPELPLDSYPPPTPTDVALYIHTSSASSIHNLKCVPITHRSILSGSRARLAWWKRTWPNERFDYLRTLGWSTWSHILGWSHDIGAATLLTSGCYIFALVPSSFDTEASKMSTVAPLDVLEQLTHAIVTKNCQIFSSVPWVLEGVMEKWKTETDSRQRLAIEEGLRAFKEYYVGGAKTNHECVIWARELALPLVFGLGMTEIGPLFQSLSDSVGWPKSDCLVQDAQLFLIKEGGTSDHSEGELAIKSSLICTGYLQGDNSAFSVEDEKTIFRTGDIYEQTKDNCLIWKGRREDFIQMSSGESLDPRVIEATLNKCPAIKDSCIIGNNFLRGAAQTVCAIIEPRMKDGYPLTSDITRAIAIVNRTLAPPLRIAWPRVLILPDGQQIPHTKKGAIFRKKMEEAFGDQMRSLLAGNDTLSVKAPTFPSPPKTNRTKSQCKDIVTLCVAEAIGITVSVLNENADSTFSELGMDSTMAVAIVNSLNSEFGLKLPLSTCHTHIDLVSLSDAVCAELGLSTPMENTKDQARHVGRENEEDIVIVGQSLRLPGNINTPESFWEALITKRNDIMTDVPENRWDQASFYRPPNSTAPEQGGDITFQKSGFIDVMHFDAAFFGISPPEAFHVSPANRLALATAFEALEDANIPISSLKGSSAGVFMASGLDEGYDHLLYAEKGFSAYNRFYGTGLANSTACGRLSYLLDIHGPSTTVDTACSSALVALDQAVQYLHSGYGDTAIVGALNTHVWPGAFGFLSAQKMTSIHSRCATFTNEADGYVPSEGAGALILKTRSAALRDGNNILASIKSTDVQHGGRSQGLIAPNVQAQVSMQRALLNKANLRPSDINFVEAHGTGTALGDLIEIEAINEVYRGSHTSDKPLIVGSGKTCIGHTETAAGLMGVIKALASLKHQVVPGMAHLKTDNLNPGIDLKVIPMQIPLDSVSLIKDKPPSGAPIRAMVLANGFAGTIAGVVLESDLPANNAAVEPKIRGLDRSYLFVVSAKSRIALQEYVKNYIRFCRHAAPSNFKSICYTSCIGREHYRYRTSFVTKDLGELVQNLESYLSLKAPPADAGARNILLCFPGQGVQYQAMARDLVEQFTGFARILNELSEKASTLTGYPILAYLVDKNLPFDLSIDQSVVAQLSIFVYQNAVSIWLLELGLVPHAVMGHSLGELAAAVVAGAFTFEFGVKFVAVRARLLSARSNHPAGMAAVAASGETIIQYIQTLGIKDGLSIAVFNSKESHVVSGELNALDEFVRVLKDDGFRVTKLNVEQGFHSPCIDAALPELKSWLASQESSFQALKIPFYSSALGRKLLENEILNVDYWVQHARAPVKFASAAAEATASKAVDILLDIGPQPTIFTSLQADVGRSGCKSVLATSTKQGRNQGTPFLQAISNLFNRGLQSDLRQIYLQASPHASIHIPTYPFQLRRFYPSTVPSRTPPTHAPKLIIKPLVVDQALVELLTDHRIEGRRVLPGAALVDFFARMCPGKAVKKIQFHRPLVLEFSDNNVVHGEVDGAHQFIMKQGGEIGSKICSGLLWEQAIITTRRKETLPVNVSDLPLRTVTHEQIYQSFNNIYFGQSFRNVRIVNVWDSHADAIISLEPSQNPEFDRIRKLDACLHMFGAIAKVDVPEVAELPGNFLPTTLEEFTLWMPDIPSKFICRYYLPIKFERNSRLLSISFDALSESGELLLSCKRYSVAWIPKGTAIQDARTRILSPSWMQPRWTLSPIPDISNSPNLHIFEELLYLGSGRLSELVAKTARRSLCLHISLDEPKPQKDVPAHNDLFVLLQQLDETLALVKGTDLSIVVDTTSITSKPHSTGFACYSIILHLMKVLVSRKLCISNFLVISSQSVPVHLPSEDSNDISTDVPTCFGVGALIQGMLRVFRSETGLSNIVWGLDLPDLVNSELSDDILETIVLNETEARFRGCFNDTLIAYRAKGMEKPLVRLCPILEAFDVTEMTTVVSGIAVVTGMGSIGQALAPALISAGASCVVFMGRKAVNDRTVCETLSRLQAGGSKECFAYVQGDVCNLDSTRAALISINNRPGTIEHIIHTAAVINDSIISNIDAEIFSEVLQPKVFGAWNLHIIANELALKLKSFVLFSSISVPLGNPGQLAYVAGNSFMDALAGHRLSSGLSATSLQLGAWESKLTENPNFNKGITYSMGNEEGIPLIIKAMTLPVPVQVIAKLDTQQLSSVPAYRLDPYFAKLVIPNLLNESSPPKPKNGKLGREEVVTVVDMILRNILEVDLSERLDFAESMNALGIDSISFAQIRGRVLQQFSIDIPMVFLSDAFSIDEMVTHIIQKYSVDNSM